MNIKDDFVLKELNEGFLVGGAVRDWLIMRERGGTAPSDGNRNSLLKDRDIVIRGAENFARKTAEIFNAIFLTLDEDNGIYRIILQDKENYLDISELQGGSIEEDLARRDFTINAIAYDLENERFIDTTGGMNDLKAGILRHIRDENFRDDPLRILRAFRFMAVLGFGAAPELQAAIKKYLPLMNNPSKERVNQELMKLFGGRYASNAVLMMDSAGLAEIIFPCIREMKLVPPNTHHHLDLFRHSTETVRQIEILYESCGEEVRNHLERVDFGGSPRINHLKLAGFLHDIGKFSVWTIDESGRHRFIRHDEIGAKLVVPLLRELKFSKRQIDYISKMIKIHIYPSNVAAAPELSEKVKMRYIRKTEDDVIDNIILAKADRLSARGKDVTDEMVCSNLKGLDELLDFYLDKRETLEPLPKLLDGCEIMDILKIKPSPVLGEIINSLKEAQLNGDIKTKNSAVKFVKTAYSKNKWN